MWWTGQVFLQSLSRYFCGIALGETLSLLKSIEPLVHHFRAVFSHPLSLTLRQYQHHCTCRCFPHNLDQMHKRPQTHTRLSHRRIEGYHSSSGAAVNVENQSEGHKGWDLKVSPLWRFWVSATMLQHMPVDRFQMCDLLPLRGEGILSNILNFTPSSWVLQIEHSHNTNDAKGKVKSWLRTKVKQNLSVNFARLHVLCTQYAVSTSHSGQPAPLHGQDLAHSAHRIHDHVHIVIKTAQGSHYLFITFHDDLEW